ncbi:MAG: hypothetical protein M1320_01360 [Patescibacteria group bacterium]|nr:hypothetical protein [Patescibacteria group bacterium]
MENTNGKFSLIIALQIICIVLILFGGGFIYKTIYDLRGTQVETLAIPAVGNIQTATTSAGGTISLTQIKTVTQTTQTSAYTFDQTGVFVFNNNNSGQSPDTWYLLYDTPQQSGNVVQLTFSNTSVCMDSAQKTLTCTLGVGFRSGLRVHVIGTKSTQGNVVQVAVLSQVAQ